MDRRSFIKNKLSEFKSKINREFSVKKMVFFGSRVSGKFYPDSDIDLIIVSDKFRRLNFIERAAKMYDYWNLNYPVDFLCFTSREFKEKSKQISIVSEAIKEGVEI